MFYLSLTLAVILLVVANLAIRTARTPMLVTVATGIVLSIAPMCLMIFTLVVPFQFLLLCVIMPFFLGTPRRSNAFLMLSFFVTAVAFAPFVAKGLMDQREYAELRNQYPYESMEERLPNPPLPAGELLVGSQARLTEFEKAISLNEHNKRSTHLHNLHESTTNVFINSPGFGVGRLRLPHASKDELERGDRVVKSVRQPGVPSNLLSSIDQHQFRMDPLIPPNVDKLHAGSIVDFANPNGFGYIKDRKHVAGFQSHRFSKLPTEKDLTVDSIELVGLLHGEPRVYLSPNLPRMDELKDVPTRTLDLFETQALEALKRGQDLSSSSVNATIRLLGSIRSTKQCIACHGGQRGDLLGAFSYVLRGDAK